MVGHGNRQDERQHPNVMHGPNSSPHRTRPAQQPNRASPTTGGCYAASKVQSSVGRKDGNQHRKRHQRVIVRANQVHGSHGTPSGCHAEQLPLSMIYSVTDGTFPCFFSSETGNVPSVPGLCPSPSSELVAQRPDHEFIFLSLLLHFTSCGEDSGSSCID